MVTAIQTVTVVIPVYNNRETLAELCRQLDALELDDARLDVVFVVDGSPDDSADVLRALAASMRWGTTLVELSRNFGSFSAIREGLRRASGDAVVVISADLQEPPDLIPAFIAEMRRSGADVVLGTRTGRSDPWRSRVSASLFWRAYRKFVQSEMPKGGIDVFALDRRALEALLRMEECNTSIVGQLLWIGFTRSSVDYQRHARVSGKSGWTLRKKLRYMTDSVFSFTDLPVRLMLGVGLVGSIAILVGSVVVIVQRALGNIEVPGYAALMLALLLVGFVLVFGLGVIGSYLWRTYENSKGRPSSIVRAVQEFDGARGVGSTENFGGADGTRKDEAVGPSSHHRTDPVEASAAVEQSLGSVAPRVPVLLLAAYLCVAVPVLLLAAAGHHWFNGDDWAMLQRSLSRPDDWVRAQNGHWSTIPVVVYQVIYGLFGLHHFWLYRLPVVFVHLATVALLWVLIRRLGISAWLTLAAVTPVVLLGSLPTNMIAPIQVSQTGSIAFGLAYLIAINHDGPFDRRDAAGMLMGLLSLAASGLGPTMVIAAGITLLLRRGWRLAAIQMVPLGLVFLAWQQVAGISGVGGPAERVDFEVVRDWIVQGMTATFSQPTRSGLGGTVLALGVLGGLALMVQRDGLSTFRSGRAVIPALIVVAVSNFAVISTQRWFLGAEYARTDRYVYVAFVLLVPVFAVALAEFARWGRALPYLFLLPLLLAVPANVNALSTRQFTLASSPDLLLGAVRHPLAESVDPSVMLDPSALTSGYVTIGWLLEADRQGKLPPPPPASEQTTAEIGMRLSLSRRDVTPPPTDCTPLAVPVDLALESGDVVHIAGPIVAQRLEDGTPTGPTIDYVVDGLFSPADELVVEVPSLFVRIVRSDNGPIELCR